MFAIANERADIIVAKDGRGHFSTIQAALDSVPSTSARTWIILVKRGTYEEKISINKSNIAIVGEDRDSTRIVYPELRRNWRATHENDFGAAVCNIGNKASDLTIASLTIYNNYGSLYGDHDHQFAVRGGGNCTRIVFINCNVLSDGGDTMSLWNTADGMYYYSNCFFNGYVDFVCPRGFCYITDSKFYEYDTTASIWHDGSIDSTSKLVIRNSSFDGVLNFRLGRNHKDAQFYLLDCRFSPSMADTPIYQAVDQSKYKWGIRYYFVDCHRDGGDYPWFRNNLDLAYDGSIKKSDITALWTFHDQWDPERTLPAVLTFASVPTPVNNACDVNAKGNDTLHWIGGRNATSYNIYFGNTAEPSFICNQLNTFYNPATLESNTTYYWRVDVVTQSDTLSGNIWQFKTKVSQ